MMDVKRKQLDAMRPCVCVRQMQQGRGIKAAAVSDRKTCRRSRNARPDCSKRALESVLQGRCLPVCHGLFRRIDFLELAIAHQLLMTSCNQILGFHALHLAQRISKRALQ